MAETIVCKPGSTPTWPWHNVMRDLEKGGLAGVIVDPESVQKHGCSGVTATGTEFVLTWMHEVILLVSLSQEDQALIDTFSKVVEYLPFCRYRSSESGLLTYEWDKKDSEGRFEALQTANEKELVKL